MRPLLLCIAAAATIMSGCARGATSSSFLNPGTIAGELRYGSGYEPDSLNPLLANTQAANDIAYAIFEPLFRYDPDGNLIPAAATQVPTHANGGISADGTTIVLHFRPGMEWSDGAPYDARDLVFTWHAVMNSRNNTRAQSGWDDIASMQLRDPTTVVVHLKTVNAGILGTFALGGAGYPPLPAHLLAALPDINRAAFNSAPISSGPFVLTAWNHGASLEFAPNPHYWRGPPKLQRLRYVIVPDTDTLLAQLRSHEIDVYESVGENQIRELATIPGVRTTTTLTANWRRLAFNLSKPVFADRRVRLAIAEAVDWDRMNATIFHGYNRRAVSDIAPSSWAAPHVPPYRYDPVDAARLLDAAGWRRGPSGLRSRDGVPLAFAVSTTNAKQSNVQSEVQMQQALRGVGIALQIKNYPGSLLFARDGPIYRGTYDTEFTIETNGPDPDNEPMWAGAFIPPHGTNTSWFDDPIVNRLSHAAATTYDRSQRRALYAQEEARIHEVVPAVFFYWQNSYSGVNADLHNWKPATYISSFWNCWEWSIGT
jgi:peptide/nickel transport system substrate-binding protein